MMALGEQQSNPPTESRGLRVAPPSIYAPRVNRWAIVVGISTYAHERLNLKYAHHDAESLYTLLQMPMGGAFEAKRIAKLVNEQATTANITRAIRSFLKKPASDDIVLLYLACHAAPDPDRPSQVYVLTYDTDPDDIAGSALPMREIDLCLRENLLAERVVIIADTCHSAAIESGTRRRGAVGDAGAINVYLDQVSQSRPGIAVLTSAESSETAREGSQWGGGHGVFTHFVLEGMRGDADGHCGPKDGIVSIGELFEYVRDQVRRATNDQQHPAIGTGSFDRSLPMAITGGVDAREHFLLGIKLHEIGWLLDDPFRFRAAAEQFLEAIRLSELAGTPLRPAELGLGKALLAAGDSDGAARALAALAGDTDVALAADALLYLGVALASRHDRTAAKEAFGRFLTIAPNDKWTSWIRSYLKRLESVAIRKHALLIGINEYANSAMPLLSGCETDAGLIRRALNARCGFAGCDIEMLQGPQATRANILEAFERLQKEVAEDDIVFVHLSGIGFQKTDFTGPDECLIVYDTNDEASCISARTLHELMKSIPSNNVTLTFDAKSNEQFERLADDDAHYTTVLACGHESLPTEMELQFDGGAVFAGAFTGLLYQQFIESDIESLTYGQIADVIRVRMNERNVHYTPEIIGNPTRRIFVAQDSFLEQFLFASRHKFPTVTRTTLAAWYERVRRGSSRPPGIFQAYGRAFLEKADFAGAIESLGVEMLSGGLPETLLALSRAHIGAHAYAEATHCLRQYVAAITVDGAADLMKPLMSCAERLTRGVKNALLVGINDYFAADIPRLRGAVNDALAMRHLLVERMGFQPDHVILLLDRDATRGAIIEEFRRLAETAREEPALFFFAGYGSTVGRDDLCIVSVDSRQNDIFDIALAELNAIAGKTAENLVTIMDAAWTQPLGKTEGLRVLPSDTRERLVTRDIGVAREVEGRKVTIGAVSIYNTNIRTKIGTAPGGGEIECPVPHPGSATNCQGELTHALIRSLDEGDERGLTYAAWLKRARIVTGFGEGLNERVFDQRTLRAAALAQIADVELRPVYETIELLVRLIDLRERQGAEEPTGRLNLGVAYAALRHYENSIRELERANAAYRNPEQMVRERQRDANADHHRAEARYQLGRAIYESGVSYARAVAELGEAVKLDPQNTAAHYFLGQAVRQMVARETLATAEEPLRIYLSRGAPLGHKNEVQQFLATRTAGVEGLAGIAPEM
jgi:tetratricopeptide (TPR) repeat protein